MKLTSGSQADGRALHKAVCSSGYKVDGGGMLKLAEKLVSTTLVHAYLIVALAREFAILDIPERERVRRIRRARQPLHAALEIVIEPLDLKQLVALHREKEAWAYDKIEGVVQITGLRQVDDGWTVQDGDASSVRIFKDLRGQMDRDGCSDSPIVMLQIMYDSRCFMTHTVPLVYDVFQDLEELIEVDFHPRIYAVPEDRSKDRSIPAASYFNSIAAYNSKEPNWMHKLINHLNEHLRFDEDLSHLRAPVGICDRDILLDGLWATQPDLLKDSAYGYFWKTMREGVYDDIHRQIRDNSEVGSKRGE